MATMQLNGEILRRMLKGGASGIRRETDRINNVKRWSKQIEYSDENVDVLTFNKGL